MERLARAILNTDFDFSSHAPLIVDAPSVVENVEEYWLWVSSPFRSGLMGLNIVWSRLLRMAEVRGAMDVFYETQLQALKREVVCWNLCELQ